MLFHVLSIVSIQQSHKCVKTHFRKPKSRIITQPIPFLPDWNHAKQTQRNVSLSTHSLKNFPNKYIHTLSFPSSVYSLFALKYRTLLAFSNFSSMFDSAAKITELYGPARPLARANAASALYRHSVITWFPVKWLLLRSRATYAEKPFLLTCLFRMIQRNSFLHLGICNCSLGIGFRGL